jgi:hypothetical protein
VSSTEARYGGLSNTTYASSSSSSNRYDESYSSSGFRDDRDYDTPKASPTKEKAEAPKVQAVVDTLVLWRQKRFHAANTRSLVPQNQRLLSRWQVLDLDLDQPLQRP